MTMHNNTATHAGRLLAGVSSNVDSHLKEIESDLNQTSALLAEAIGKLTANFLAVHASIAQYRETCNALDDSSGHFASVPDERAVTLRQEIDKQIDAIVTGLQFQDMTEQLLDRTKRRVHGVRKVMETLEMESVGLAAQTPVDDGTSAIDRLDTLFRQQNDALEGSLRRAVMQTRMDSGDIDLF